MKSLGPCLLIAMTLHCATARSVRSWQSGDTFILSGTSLNSQVLRESQCATLGERAGAAFDLPFSMVLDVALLAATIPLQLLDFIVRIGPRSGVKSHTSISTGSVIVLPRIRVRTQAFAGLGSPGSEIGVSPHCV